MAIYINYTISTKHKGSEIALTGYTRTVRMSPGWSLFVGNVLWTGGSTFKFILLQVKSFFCGEVSLTVLFLVSVFCVLSSNTWLEEGQPLPPSISNISALEAELRGRTTLTRGRSHRLPPRLLPCDTDSSFRGLAYLQPTQAVRQSFSFTYLLPSPWTHP